MRSTTSAAARQMTPATTQAGVYVSSDVRIRDLRPLLMDGFVVLEVGRTDRRQRVIAIIPEGQGVYRKARPLWLRAQADFERVVGDTQASALRDLLATVSRTPLGEAAAATRCPPACRAPSRRRS
ncbi:hypothetical protein [Corallococcus sp. AB011P]|uniref:hypothetical protein n=1 Tax=Corallococcus sp. AB011P TaxID=2316735 RepID=UPI0018F7693A|nr:hypothetical protein [Corallococcus sp. AB011P]